MPNPAHSRGRLRGRNPWCPDASPRYQNERLLEASAPGRLRSPHALSAVGACGVHKLSLVPCVARLGQHRRSLPKGHVIDWGVSRIIPA